MLFIFMNFMPLTHEVFHYIPALLLGMNPRIDATWRRTHIEPAGTFKSLVVLLCPAALGILMLLLVIVMLREWLVGDRIQRIVFYIILIVFAVWLSGSASDVLRAIHFARTGRWKKLKPMQKE